MSRQTPVHIQNARRLELYEINSQRVLTNAEAAELESLEHRSYMRAWRAQQRETEQRIAQLAARRSFHGPRRHVA